MRTDRKQQRHVIMTSYGGFGLPMSPQFSVLVSIMMELGVTFALPHIRGGGEFGREWHDAARGRNRQVAFDDFIAAAEWLCSDQVTTAEQLAIFGGSNSGLLVGAAMTQRPDLFRAVLCIAPLLDMVRYEFFDQALKWRHEYGTVADLEDFGALYAISPYHHIAEDINYPSILFVTGDKDDRCNPAHVRKMAARLQERSAQRSPVVVDYSEQRGHSPVLPLSVRIDALARRIAFLCRELKFPVDFGARYETPCA
jgi:prolyl oligopeptidase